MMITPDGTVLNSRHRHDFIMHMDMNGHEYFLDGGTDYVRWGVSPGAPAPTFKILYEDDDFEEIRKYHCRGGRGRDGTEPLKFVPLCEMNDEWLDALITYQEDLGLRNHWTTNLYREEIKFRKNESRTSN